MKEPKHTLEKGTRIRTHTGLGTSLSGVFVTQTYLDSRRSDQRGEVAGIVPGAGGDVYWVRHFDADLSISVYGWWEFELDEESALTRFDHEEPI